MRCRRRGRLYSKCWGGGTLVVVDGRRVPMTFGTSPRCWAMLLRKGCCSLKVEPRVLFTAGVTICARLARLTRKRGTLFCLLPQVRAGCASGSRTVQTAWLLPAPLPGGIAGLRWPIKAARTRTRKEGAGMVAQPLHAGVKRPTCRISRYPEKVLAGACWRSPGIKISEIPKKCMQGAENQAAQAWILWQI